MSLYSPENEIKNIYEKSVKLLSTSQAQLNQTRKILKKSVIRLSAGFVSGDKQVDSLLKDISDSANEHINLENLDSQLDKLFVLTNHSDFQKTVIKQSDFKESLKHAMQGIDCTDDCKSIINKLTQQQTSEAETAVEIIEIINHTLLKVDQVDEDKLDEKINGFIDDIASSTGLKYDRKNHKSAEVMQDMVIELSKYIMTVRQGDNKNDLKSSDKKTRDLSFYSHLTDMVNQLALPAKMKPQQIAILKKLVGPVDSNKYRKSLFSDILHLINEFVNSVQIENKDMQTFILKINAQLSEIKKYMEMTLKSQREASSRSSDLEDSVNASVEFIQDKVSIADDIDDLKKGISVHLKEIRKQVEDNKQAAEEKEDLSMQGFSQIIDELNTSQQESDRLKNELEESKSQLLRDTLTGMYNRLAYEERIIVEASRYKRLKSPLTLAIWDIDHFKSVNDTYGHDVGDRVLKLFANVIQQRIRKTDMFARIGGEEFVLLMPDTPIDKALVFNNKLREILLNCNFKYQGKQITITSSVGLSEFTENDSEQLVLKRADQALYQSKHSGRNRCTVFQGEVDA